MMSKSEISRKFKLDEMTWPYSFTLKYTDRSMKLYTRTRDEFQQWLRILGLFVSMNRNGIDLCSMNPIVYENQNTSKSKNFEERRMTDTEILENFIASEQDASSLPFSNDSSRNLQSGEATQTNFKFLHKTNNKLLSQEYPQLTRSQNAQVSDLVQNQM